MRALEFFDRHPVFRHEEFVAAHTAAGRSPATSNNLLAHHVSSGRLLRVRRGLFAVVPRGQAPDTFAVDSYLLATKLTADAVIAYHAALQFHGRAYSVWRRYPYVTAHRAKPLEFRGMTFVPVTLPPPARDLPDLGGGIATTSHEGGLVRVTTLERTLVDVLDAPQHGGDWEEIWRSLEMVEYFDLDAVIRHALALESAMTAARVGFFLAQHREELMIDDRDLRPLRDAAPRQPRYFDPRHHAGTLLHEWNLIVPQSILLREWGAVS